MRKLKRMLFVGALAALVATPVLGQVYKYYTPGSVWTITMVKISPGMDQMYMQYLSSELKKQEEAQIKAGLQKSYKVLRTMDDSGWNLLILREYSSLASIEANAEKADVVTQQTTGTDQQQMQGYQDRAKYRELIGTKYARELVLK